MAKLSQQTKENIKIIIFVVTVVLLIATYGVYPLINSDTLFARDNFKTYNIDSLALNDITIFENQSWLIDSFRVDTDGLTSLACLAITDTTIDSAVGTVILIPSDKESRETQLPLIQLLTQNSYNCITYDQRATGLSTGKHHGFGDLEATDLQELISYLEIRDLLLSPLYIVGSHLGADAALSSANVDSRIKKVVAIEPYLITDNIIEDAKTSHGSISFPFYNSVMYWWYDKNAGYAPPYIKLEDITEVACLTKLFTNNKTDATQALQNKSDETKLTIRSYTNTQLNDSIMAFIQK